MLQCSSNCDNCLPYKTDSYLFCLLKLIQAPLVYNKTYLVLNSSDNGAEISERLHQLADGLPDQGTIFSNWVIYE